MKNLVVLAVLVALAAPAHAGEIYRWVEGSTVVYSDRPPQDGVVATEMPGREPLPAVTTGAATIGPSSSAENGVSTAPPTGDESLEVSGATGQPAGLAGPARSRHP